MLVNVVPNIFLLVLQWEKKFSCLFTAHLVLFGKLKGDLELGAREIVHT